MKTWFNKSNGPTLHCRRKEIVSGGGGGGGMTKKICSSAIIFLAYKSNFQKTGGRGACPVPTALNHLCSLYSSIYGKSPRIRT